MQRLLGAKVKCSLRGKGIRIVSAACVTHDGVEVLCDSALNLNGRVADTVGVMCSGYGMTAAMDGSSMNGRQKSGGMRAGCWRI